MTHTLTVDRLPCGDHDVSCSVASAQQIVARAARPFSVLGC